VIEDIRAFIGNLRRKEQQLSIRECLVVIRDKLHPPQSLDFNIQAPDTAPPFSSTVFESICLIVNEAVSNAIRHANASTIDISAEMQHSHFTIVVEDDGQGFDSTQMNGFSGLGLRNMNQRARFYGGEVIIDSKPGAGTKLTINIPLGVY
jgi:signal transduction histidine kinase